MFTKGVKTMKKSARITTLVNSRPKQFLKYIASLYDCELKIEDEEHFSCGFFNLTKMVTIWFSISGAEADSCYTRICSSFENWKKGMLSNKNTIE